MLGVTIVASITGEPLSRTHVSELREESAISPEQIAERGYATIKNPKALPMIFTGDIHTGSGGLLIPIWNTLGEIGTYQFKPAAPPIRDGKPVKYLNPSGGNVCLDVPVAARRFLDDAEAELWISEGPKKIDSAVSNGIPCIIGLLGVGMWQRDGMALPDWKDVRLKGRPVVIAFDSDVMTKPAVRGQLDGLASWLTYRGAIVRFCLMPPLADGAKCGLDDVFAAGLTRHDLAGYTVDSLPDAGPAWDEPMPLHESAGPLFPVAALPGQLGAYVAAVAEATQTPPDLAGVLALGTVSAAARGRYAVRIPEHDWREPLVIQGVAFLPSGERKSAVVGELTAPIVEWERERHLEDESQIQEWASRHRVLKKQLDAAENAASKGREPGER